MYLSSLQKTLCAEHFSTKPVCHNTWQHGPKGATITVKMVATVGNKEINVPASLAKSMGGAMLALA